MINVSSWLAQFLIDPRCRIYRHMLLFFFSATTIGLNYYTDLIEQENLWQDFAQSIFLLVPIYLSVFVLTPRFLLRNKVGTYVVSVYLCIGVAFIFSYLLRSETIRMEYEKFQFWISLFLIISSVIQLTLIIAGASAVIVFQDYIRNALRIDQLENATMQSELEQLKNQINPHFLFNMLNNANVLVKENPAEAVLVLSKLKDLLKYQLKDSVSEEVRLKDEVRFLSDYLNMEKIRRDNFDFIVSTEGDIEEVVIAPLLFIPFVENAVKHNNDNKKLSYVHLYFKIEKEILIFICINSKPIEQKEQLADSGIGLANIRRRLELLYDSDHSLEIEETDITYTINLRLKLRTRHADSADQRGFHI